MIALAEATATAPAAGALGWIELALVLFVLVFLAITVRVIIRRKGYFDGAARIPLEDAPVEEREQ